MNGVTLKATARLMIMAMLLSSSIAMAETRKEKKARKKLEAQEAAKATNTVPVSAQVDILSIPYDPNLPRYVVTVEPLKYGALGAAPEGAGASSRTTNTTTDADGNTTTSVSETTTGHDVGQGLAAQLVTALTNGGNLSVALNENVKKDGEGGYTTKMLDSEIGVFVIRGVVTEFNETAEAAGRTRKVGLGRIGALVGIAGLATGNDGVAVAGGVVAVANPSYSNEAMSRTGLVGIDFQVIDGRTGRILGSFTAKGTFGSVTKAKGMSIFGIGGGSSEFYSSALGQATRVAMNEALEKTMNTLIRAPR